MYRQFVLVVARTLLEELPRGNTMESHSMKFGRRHYAGPFVDMVQRTDRVRFSSTLLNVQACERYKFFPQPCKFFLGKEGLGL